MAIKPKLNTFDATMIVVSLVIGIGIFRTPAMVASAARTPFLFLLGISVNVLLTQTREALFGLALFASGYPVFRLMRRTNRDLR